jgi:hypothetical protein
MKMMKKMNNNSTKTLAITMVSYMTRPLILQKIEKCLSAKWYLVYNLEITISRSSCCPCEQLKPQIPKEALDFDVSTVIINSVYLYPDIIKSTKS